MKTIKYEKFLEIQNNISIDNLIQIHYDYGELNTIISYISLEYITSLEEFICMVWKKDFYQDDKFDYALQENEKGVIKEEDLPIDDDFLIDVKCMHLKEALKNYLKKSDYEKLDIDFESIYDCYFLSSNKDYILNDYKSILYESSFIFKDEKRIYMVEHCIDC